MTRFCTISVPVTNLRSKPFERSPGGVAHDELQESQLLFGEGLAVTGEEGNWLAVEALEQPKYDPIAGWRPYPGWVKRRDAFEVKSLPKTNCIVTSPFLTLLDGPSAAAPPVLSVSLGTRMVTAGETGDFAEVLLNDGKRGWAPNTGITEDPFDSAAPAPSRNATRAACLFLGIPYLWGGRSMPLPGPGGPAMGVDCSGLVDLAFRVIGRRLPRNAHDQWLAATPIGAEEVEEGDLIFLSYRGRHNSISHVMLSLGGERFIEAFETGDVVRIGTFYERLGRSRLELKENNRVRDGAQVHFGRIKDSQGGKYVCSAGARNVSYG